MNKRGYVLTLDITIALLTVLGILALAAVMLSETETGAFLEMQQVRVSNDIITILDERGILQSDNASLINSTIVQLLPANFEMSLLIKTYYYTGISFSFRNITRVGEVTNETDRFIGQGKRTFIKMYGSSVGNYSTVDYNIWVK
ncbi:MAG: hypothetical protein V1839_01340 [archaeon]